MQPIVFVSNEFFAHPQNTHKLERCQLEKPLGLCNLHHDDIEAL